MAALTPAQAKAVEAHVGHVRRLASRLCRQWPHHIDRHDVEQLGHTGLIDAVQRYTPENGASIWTFAEPRVRGAILDGLRRGSWPRGVRRDRALMLDPRSAGGVRHARRAHIARIESMVDNAPGGDIPDWVHGISPVEDAQAVLARKETRALVKAALLTLPARDRRIVVEYYWRGRTQRDIGRDLGVVECRISQLLSRALTRLLPALDPSLHPKRVL
jgi:RNA polymerase sigma factor for flagellar operon FliA